MHYYPCRKAGCKGLVATPGYCEKHQGAQGRELEAPSWSKETAWRKGYDTRWNKARIIFLNAHPLCASCGKTATLVDHIVPHGGDKELFWDENNWQALCKGCHSVKSRREYFDEVRGRNTLTCNGYNI